MSDDPELKLSVGHIPEKHTVVGFLAYIKVLDDDGEMYWASRSDGLNDMEKLGMALNQLDDFQEQLRVGRHHLGGE